MKYNSSAIAILTAFILFSFFDSSYSYGEPYIRLTSSENINCGTEFHTNTKYTLFDVWVWLVPDADGVLAAEFRMDTGPHLEINREINPEVADVLGDIDDFFAVHFNSCQTEPIWLFHFVFLNMTTDPSYIGPFSSNHSSSMLVATCIEPDHPVKELFPMELFGFNTYSYLCGGAPNVTKVELIDDDLIRIKFVHSKPAFMCGDEVSSFRVYQRNTAFFSSSFADTIHVTDSHWDYSNCPDCLYCPDLNALLRLEKPLDPSHEFILCLDAMGSECCYLGGREHLVFSVPDTMDVDLARHSEWCYGDRVNIKWSMAKTDSDYEYKIERSVDGQGFESVKTSDLRKTDNIYNFNDDNILSGHTYQYSVTAIYLGFEVELFQTDLFTVPFFPADITNYPNPFNPSTNIVYSLPETGPVTINIYDSSGRLVRRLMDNKMMFAGKHTISWDGKNDKGITPQSGIYYCQLKTGGYNSACKMVLIK